MKPPEPKRPDKIELRPDGWQRFEEAIDAATHTGGPIHNPKAKKPAKAKSAPKKAARKRG